MRKHDEAYWRAYCRAGAKLGFHIHLVAYITVNLLLVFINYSTSPQYLWFRWPLLGWGIGLLFHWLAVFVRPKLMRHFIQRELEKNRSGD
ncbi:MAG: 2TM domain-containing protein [Planctomycetota bacterium]|nr:2TM domain-containing protein [Planctomycetota bacterium]